MRTSRKSISPFQEIVNSRGNTLRSLTYDELQGLRDAPVEDVLVGSRAATIATIIEHKADMSLRVVVQGFMKARLLGKWVALDGFYKHPDGVVKPMADDEFFEFD